MSHEEGHKGGCEILFCFWGWETVIIGLIGGSRINTEISLYAIRRKIRGLGYLVCRIWYLESRYSWVLTAKSLVRLIIDQLPQLMRFYEDHPSYEAI